MPKQPAHQTIGVVGLGRVDDGTDSSDAVAINNSVSLLPIPASQHPAYLHRTALHAHPQIIIPAAG